MKNIKKWQLISNKYKINSIALIKIILLIINLFPNRIICLQKIHKKMIEI